MTGLQEYTISDIRVVIPQVVRVRLYRIPGHDGVFCGTDYLLQQPLDWCSDVVEIEVDA